MSEEGEKKKRRREKKNERDGWNGGEPGGSCAIYVSPVPGIMLLLLIILSFIIQGGERGNEAGRQCSVLWLMDTCLYGYTRSLL